MYFLQPIGYSPRKHDRLIGNWILYIHGRVWIYWQSMHVQASSVPTVQTNSILKCWVQELQSYWMSLKKKRCSTGISIAHCLACCQPLLRWPWQTDPGPVFCVLFNNNGMAYEVEPLMRKRSAWFEMLIQHKAKQSDTYLQIPKCQLIKVSCLNLGNNALMAVLCSRR